MIPIAEIECAIGTVGRWFNLNIVYTSLTFKPLKKTFQYTHLTSYVKMRVCSIKFEGSNFTPFFITKARIVSIRNIKAFSCFYN